MNPLASSSSSLRQLVLSSTGSLTSRRSLHSTSIIRSHIGALPLPIPTNVKLDLPALSLPLTTLSNSSTRSISITGPLGSTSLRLPNSLVLNPSTVNENTILGLTVQDETVPEQRALWGLTRALLWNAVVGVSEGYRVVLRMVGVGYRASVEPIPATLLAVRSTRSPSSSSSSSTTTLAPPKDRLNLKLGYAHPVYIDIPSDITVTTPQPTRIVLSGTDKQKLGLFAAKIRRWRKPEPYRGKGIFVGDETIKLKEIKKK